MCVYIGVMSTVFALWGGMMSFTLWLDQSLWDTRFPCLCRMVLTEMPKPPKTAPDLRFYVSRVSSPLSTRLTE